MWTGATRRAAERVQLPAAPANGGNEFPTTAAAAGDESFQSATKQQSLQPLGKRRLKTKMGGRISYLSSLFEELSFSIRPSLFKAAVLTHRDRQTDTESEYNFPYHMHIIVVNVIIKWRTEVAWESNGVFYGNPPATCFHHVKEDEGQKSYIL